MGKTQSKNVVDTKMMNETVMKSIMKNNTSTDAQMLNVQNMNISSADFKCKVDISQSTTAEMKVVQDINNETRNKMINDVTDKLESKMKSEFEKSGINMDSGSKTMSKMKTEVKNVFKTTIDIEKTNKLIAKMNNFQNMNAKDLVFDPCGIKIFEKVTDSKNTEIAKYALDKLAEIGACNVECNISQNMIVSLVAEQLVKDMATALISNKKLTKLATKLESKTTVKGFNLSGTLIAIAIAVAILGIIFLFMMV